MKPIVKIGTRGSRLALYQAELVKTKLEQFFPQARVEIVRIKTGGDMIRRGGMHPLETKHIYTKEIEEALQKGEVDIAVHSAKDLAAVLPEGLGLGAVLEREDPRDCLVSQDKKKLAELPLGARIGTSALRRKMQLKRLNTELIIEEMHGNVDTRIRKLEEGKYDAIVLALAGLKRLGLANHVAEAFCEDQFYPAPGQGVIVVQSRQEDEAMGEMLHSLHHKPTAIRLDCERAFLKKLEGGCQLPCGIWTQIQSGTLKAGGALFAVDKHEWVEQRHEGPARQAEELGTGLAELILENGGRQILEQIRESARQAKS